MKRDEKIEFISDEALLSCFNNRDAVMFSQAYKKLFGSLYLYASKLYSATTIDPADKVQDAFVYIWEQENLSFDSLIKLRSYATLYIKNKYLNHIDSLKAVNNYKESIRVNEEYNYDTLKCEVFSLIDEMYNILPSRYAKTIEMILKGYDSSEIAEIIGCSIQAVYKYKTEAIKVLRVKLSKKLFSTILLFV